MSIKIRRATVEDVREISDIHAQSWKVAYKDIIPQQYLEDLKNDFWVLYFKNMISDGILKVQIVFEDNVPVGCISYGKARDKDFDKSGEIISIYVISDYWRKGYGNKLLEAALEDMKKDGYKSVYLWVLEENNNATQFYEKNGFSFNGDKNVIQIMDKALVDLRYVHKQ